MQNPDSWGTADHYAVLGVARDASPAQIARAYRTRMRALHPDTSSAPPASADRLTEVTTAYTTLRDSTRRADYDATLPRRATGPGERRYTRVVHHVVDSPDADTAPVTLTVTPRDPQPALWIGPTRAVASAYGRPVFDFWF